MQIRIAALNALRARGFGHVGGILSISDLLAVLYGSVMRYDPKNPDWMERDKLVCSKGHAAPALQAVLALKGFFPEEELKTLNQPGTKLPSHCDRLKTPGIDMTAGSLGQGTSAAVGIALGDALAKRDSKTYLIVGDGELNEGQVWEAAMFTAGKNVKNVMWFIDNNKKQLDGTTDEIMPLFDIRAKFESFGFEALDVDGHDIEALYNAITKPISDKPRAIIMDTVKGKGVRDIEETVSNHSITTGTEVWTGWIEGLEKELADLEKEAV